MADRSPEFNAQDPPPPAEESDLPLAEAPEPTAEECFELGHLRREQGDLEAAEAAWRRGDQRGDGPAAAGLGALLHQRGDAEGAEAAFRRGDERGDGAAASNLGALLERRGDLEGAEAAFRRGDERGNGTAAAGLGNLLHERGDVEGAEAAYRRGDDAATARPPPASATCSMSAVTSRAPRPRTAAGTTRQRHGRRRAWPPAP